MTRLAKRNKTRWIKLWKRRGLYYRGGSFWRKQRWQLPIAFDLRETALPITYGDIFDASEWFPVPALLASPELTKLKVAVEVILGGELPDSL